MVSLTPVGPSGIPEGDPWKEISSEDTKNNETKSFFKDALVDEKGRVTTYEKAKYKVLDVKIRERSRLERVGRGVAGFFLSLPLITLFIKPVRNLFTSKEELVAFTQKISEEELLQLKARVKPGPNHSTSQIEGIAKSAGISSEHTLDQLLKMNDESLRAVLREWKQADKKVDKNLLISLFNARSSNWQIANSLIDLDKHLARQGSDAGINSPLSKAIANGDVLAVRHWLSSRRGHRISMQTKDLAQHVGISPEYTKEQLLKMNDESLIAVLREWKGADKKVDKNLLRLLFNERSSNWQIANSLINLDKDLARQGSDAGINSPLSKAIIANGDERAIRSWLYSRRTHQIPILPVELWLLKAKSGTFFQSNVALKDKLPENFFSQENFNQLKDEEKKAIIAVAEQNPNSSGLQSVELKKLTNLSSPPTDQDYVVLFDILKNPALMTFAGVFFGDPKNTLPVELFLKYIFDKDESGKPRILQLNKAEDVDFFLEKAQALKISDQSYLPALLTKWADEPAVVGQILIMQPDLERHEAKAGIHSPLAQAIIRTPSNKGAVMHWMTIRNELTRDPTDPVPFNDAELWLLKAINQTPRSGFDFNSFYTQENFQKLEPEAQAAVIMVAEKNTDTPSVRTFLAQLHRFQSPAPKNPLE